MIGRLRKAKRLIPPPGADYVVTQGVLLDWNPDTFENVVDIDGTQFTNVRVHKSIDATSWKPGEVVTVEQWYPGGKKGELGVGSYCIRGQIITPGTDAASKAVESMRSAVVKQVSAQVFAERIHDAYIPGLVASGDTSFNWVSLGGPTISDIDVVSGKMIMFVDARIHVSTFDLGGSSGECTVVISGATSVAAQALDRKELSLDRGSNLYDTSIRDRSSTMFIATGLNPGKHTVEVQYRAFVSGGGHDVDFAQRGLLVIAY